MAREWKPEQLKAMQLLAKPESSMSYEDIAKECGVSYGTIYNWRQDPDFIDAVNALAYSLLKGNLPKIYDVLIQKAEEGNAKCIEMCLKYIGNYVEKTEAKISADMEINVNLTDE